MNALKAVPSPHGDLRDWFMAVTDNIVILNRTKYYLQDVAFWEKGAKPSCGNCQLWMTNCCPKERHNKRGHREGPSMNGMACDNYRENYFPAHLIQLAAASRETAKAVLEGREFSRWPNPAQSGR